MRPPSPFVSLLAPHVRRPRRRATAGAWLAAAIVAVSACGPASTGTPDASGSAGRLVAIDKDGHAASLELDAPFAVRATADLGAPTGSLRCRGDRCLVVQPSPTDAVVLLRASDLSVVDTFPLASGADPRDVAFVDDRTAVVSQYGSAALRVLDLTTGQGSDVDLSVLADADGNPEANRIASCGHVLYVQLARLDAKTGSPAAEGSALAVVDLDRVGAERVVDADPGTAGTQGVSLAGRPDFDMPVDCAASRLYVAEPKPLFSGGGAYEQVDLVTRTASDYPIANGAQVGGFDVVEPGLFWRITHTDFGPGASSHLECVGGTVPDTYNTFSGYHVDDLALDRVTDTVFFPDPCTYSPSNAGCLTGVHAFHARTGARVSALPVDVGFGPTELAVAR